MKYTLAHGTANDFVVIADLDDDIEVSAAFARTLTDRRRGLGADGVLRLGAPQVPDAEVFMDHRNADGSLAEMCGNGVRVVAKHVLDHGVVTGESSDVVRVQTRAGVKPVRVVARHHDGTVAEVAVDMGPPVTRPAQVPFDAEDPDALIHHIVLDGPAAGALAVTGTGEPAAVPAAYDTTVGPDVVEFGVVSMGNPHAVIEVADVTTAPVDAVGPWLETHPRFPNQVNVGFAQVVDRDHLFLRVWERGVGETQACGTGACAAVVALQRRGLLDDEVNVDLPGGRLHIAHRPGETVTMTGPAVEVAHGELAPAWLTAASRGERED